MVQAAGEVTLQTIREEKRRPFLIDLMFRLVREKPLGTVGGVIVLILLLVGIFADWLAPFGYNEIHLADSFTPPSTHYILGTDELGRDLLSRVIYGARISMYVGLGCSAIGVVISVLIGSISGYLGGTTDLMIQRLVDAWMAFPSLMIILAVMTVVGTGLVQVMVVLGVLFGVSRTRVVRSAVVSIKENIYVEAARAIGCTHREILIRHILPNITAPIIVLFTVDMGTAIITEASISFLGLGIPPPTPSWGGMLSWAGRQYMRSAPWMAIWPGLALAIVVYGINMLGDGLRDIFDPRLRGGLGRYGGVRARIARIGRSR